MKTNNTLFNSLGKRKLFDKYLALSFFSPIVILGIAFAFNKVYPFYPFGKKLLLIDDFYHQYYPFFSSLWHKVREGTLSTWSWSGSAGHDYLSLITYYMASPLTLFTLLFPHSWLHEVLSVIILVKIGFAGLFATIFLRYSFKNDSTAAGTPTEQPYAVQTVFSFLFALCTWLLSYYWNIMWLDSFALLPLVMMGLLALINEGKYLQYTITLSLSVLFNYYMGMFVCIFTAIFFFSVCIIKKLTFADFLRKLKSIAVCSILALGMAAIFLLPSYFNIRNTDGVQEGFSDKLYFYENFFDIMGNFLAFTKPTVMKGPHNLYTGMISVLLAGLFFYSPKVSRREKFVFGGIIVFLLFACNLNFLDYAIHGFRYTNALPYRYTFIISFMMMIMACRAYQFTDNLKIGELLIMSAGAVVCIVSAVIGPEKRSFIAANVILCVVYLSLLYFKSIWKDKKRTIMEVALLLVIVSELSINSYLGIKEIGMIDRELYTNKYDDIQELLFMREPVENDFYRTDINDLRIFNEAYLFNCKGISFFASTANTFLSSFLAGIGLPRALYNNRYWYTETTPINNALLNMRYFISRRNKTSDNAVYWEIIDQAGDATLHENLRYLPLGFMVTDSMADYVANKNPLLSQNDLFRRMTGLYGDVFAVYDISSLMETDPDGMSAWTFKIPFNTMLYAFCKSDVSEFLNIGINGKNLRFLPVTQNTSYIFPVNYVYKGDIIRFALFESLDASMYLGLFNVALFEQGYAKLASQTLQLTKFTETNVSGNITVLNNGLLYTSIPADNNNWSVYVDGKKSKVVLIGKAMVAVHLNEGYHEVEFKYCNKFFVAGIIISLVSLVLFVTIATRKGLGLGKMN